MANCVLIKQENIEGDIEDEKEVPAYSNETSPKAAADVPIKVKQVCDWPGEENADEDEIS